MKLYIYDHCPYCVKVRMIFGYKNLNLDLKTLLNDDEEGPIKMIGQKMLPILELEKEEGEYMPESLDIIDYIDGKFEDKRFINIDIKEHSKLTEWFAESRNYLYPLAMPRWVKVGLEEFKTQSAIDYFTKKKEDRIGDFQNHLKNTDELIKQASDHLKALENLLSKNQSFFSADASINDFHLYATLRSLSVTKGINFPNKVLNYMRKQEELTKVPLHFDIAI